MRLYGSVLQKSRRRGDGGNAISTNVVGKKTQSGYASLQEEGRGVPLFCVYVRTGYICQSLLRRKAVAKSSVAFEILRGGVVADRQLACKAVDGRDEVRRREDTRACRMPRTTKSSA